MPARAEESTERPIDEAPVTTSAATAESPDKQSPDADPPDDGEPITHARLPLPERLDRTHQYLICGRTKLVAVWKNNGQGWMVKTKTGLVSAARNPDQLPNQGDFRLVELRLDHTDDGLRLNGLRVYQLAQRWALTCLDKGDDPIVSKVTDQAGLNRDQKNVVRQALKEQFMPEVWMDAREVLDFLASADFHSASVG